MKSIIFIGGVGSSKSRAERVVGAAVDLGIATDGEGLTLNEARKMSDKHLASLINCAGMLGTHSAGVTAVPHTLEVRSAFYAAPPEPRPLGGLLIGGIAKTVDHFTAKTPYLRREHIGVALSTLLLSARDLMSMVKVPGFSTAREITKGNLTDPAVTTYVAMSNDRFFPMNDELLHDILGETGVTTVTIDGHHDDISVEPRVVLQQVYQGQGSES